MDLSACLSSGGGGGGEETKENTRQNVSRGRTNSSGEIAERIYQIRIWRIYLQNPNDCRKTINWRIRGSRMHFRVDLSPIRISNEYRRNSFQGDSGIVLYYFAHYRVHLTELSPLSARQHVFTLVNKICLDISK